MSNKNYLKIPYLGVRDVSEIVGLKERQIRNLAPKIPGAFQNSSGWQIPSSGIEWIKNRPKPGPKPIKHKEK